MHKRQRTGFEFTKKSTSTAKKPRSTAEIKATVNRQIMAKAETKWIDTTYSGVMNASNTALGKDLSPTTKLCLNGLQQGTDVNKRVGKKITIKSIHVSGLIRFLGKESSVASNQPSPPSGKSVWVDLVWSKQNDQSVTAPLTSEIYNNNIGTVQGSGMLIRNPDFEKEYKVLRRFRYDLPARPFLKEAVAISGATLEPDLYSWPEHIVHFEFFYKFKKGLKVRYSSNTGNIDDIIDHAFHIMGGYGTETETDSAPICSYQARVKFVDI